MNNFILRLPNSRICHHSLFKCQYMKFLFCIIILHIIILYIGLEKCTTRTHPFTVYIVHAGVSCGLLAVSGVVDRPGNTLLYEQIFTTHHTLRTNELRTSMFVIYMTVTIQIRLMLITVANESGPTIRVAYIAA